MVIQAGALLTMTVLPWYEIKWMNRRDHPSKNADYVHLWKDAIERKNARRHKDFGHCKKSETMFALAKLGYCNNDSIA